MELTKPVNKNYRSSPKAAIKIEEGRYLARYRQNNKYYQFETPEPEFCWSYVYALRLKQKLRVGLGAIEVTVIKEPIAHTK